MKKILCSLSVIGYLCTHAAGQTINVAPKTLSLTYPGPAETDTISATGLVPESGNLLIDVPIKYVVSTGGYWDYSATLPYSGGTLPPTPVGFMYGFSGSGWSTITISGGGASAEICVRGNNPPYQCTTTSVSSVSHEPSIIISPNPAANSLTLSSTKNITSIAIRNLLGSTVYAQQCNNRELQLDISTLSNGLYLLWINDTEVRKFVKN